MSWPWRRRPRRLDLMPPARGNGRERAAQEALREAERKASDAEPLIRRGERLAAEAMRALGLR